MATASQLDDWRKHRRQSFAALPGHAVFLAVVVVALVGLHWWIGLRLWAWLAAIGLSCWGLVGDLINIVYLDRRIAAAGREMSSEESGAANAG